MSVSLLTTPFGSATQLASGLFLALGEGSAAGFLADGAFAQVAGMTAARDEVLGAELSHIIAEAQTTGNGRGSEMARSEFTKILSGGARGDTAAPPAPMRPLDHVNARLADEHARASWLDDGLYKIGVPFNDRESILAKAQNLRHLRLAPESGGAGGFGAVLRSGPGETQAVEIALPSGLKVVNDDILQMLAARALYDAFQPSASKPDMAAPEEVNRLKQSLEMSAFEDIARIVTDGGPQVLCKVAEGIAAANPFWGVKIFIDAAKAYADIGGDNSVFCTWLGAAQTINRAGHPTTIMPTSLTLRYRQDSWGIQRIALDGIQNHLPSDSGGTQASIEFYISGRGWVGFDQRDTFKPEDVRQIRFSDDGTGFNSRLLPLLYSTKIDDIKSIGEKGEGLKLMITACIRNGIRVTLESSHKDYETGEIVSWRAVPFTRTVMIDGDEVRQLHFAVEETGRTKGDKATGSKTTFDAPPALLTKFAQNEMERKVLALRTGFTPLYHGEAGDVVDDSKWVFVKGVYIMDSQSINLGFGYNFTTISTNGDRNNVSQSEILYGLRKVFEGLDDEEVIKALIKKGAEGHDLLEFKVLDSDYQLKINPATGEREIMEFRSGARLKSGDIWKKCFENLYPGKKVALSSSNLGCDDLARLNGYTVVKLPFELRYFLERHGVEASDKLKLGAMTVLLRDEKYALDAKIGSMETSWTQDDGRIPWGPKRVALDVLSNHMDAGSVEIEYLVPIRDDYRDDKMKFGWVSRNPVLPPIAPRGVRIVDKGNGYEIAKLNIAYTDKTPDENGKTIGGFGEGAKRISLAILKMARVYSSNLAIRFRSTFDGQGWAAVPIEADISEGDIRTQKLCYATAEGLFPEQGSITTIYDPTTDIMDIFNNLGRYVLQYNPEYRPIYETGEGAVFDPSGYSQRNRMEKHGVFARDFHITDEHDSRLLFSYNLNFSVEDITPDRNDVPINRLSSAVAAIIGACTDLGVITKIVEAAERDKEKLEFVPLNFTGPFDPRAEVWRRAFRNVHGEKAVLASGNSAMAMEAIHLGYKPVSLNPKIRETLLNAGIETDKDKIGEGLECAAVPREELTDAEREMLDMIPKLDDAIFAARPERSPPPVVVVYSRAWTKGGEVRDDTIGFYRRKTGAIYIKRDQLAKIRDFAKTYVHERGHQLTGAADAEDAFREFFEDLAWLHVGAHIGGRNSFTDEVSEMAARLAIAQADERGARERLRAFAANLEAADSLLRQNRLALDGAKEDITRRESELAQTRERLEDANARADREAAVRGATSALLDDAREQLANQEAAIRSIAGGLAMYMPADKRPDLDVMPVDSVLAFISNRTKRRFLWRRMK